jgi:hypothetical protein
MQKKKNEKFTKLLEEKLDKLISKKEKENSALKLLLNIDGKTESTKKSK